MLPCHFGSGKDNSFRMCVDFRHLNKVTVTEQWPLHRNDDILDGLCNIRV